MNSTQNKKIEQVKETTLVIGIDIGSESHYARAFDWRGFEYSKKAFQFLNTDTGFEALLEWIEVIKVEKEKKEILVGMEPTGHYWFNLVSSRRLSGGIFVRLCNGIPSQLIPLEQISLIRRSISFFPMVTKICL